MDSFQIIGLILLIANIVLGICIKRSGEKWYWYAPVFFICAIVTLQLGMALFGDGYIRLLG